MISHLNGIFFGSTDNAIIVMVGDAIGLEVIISKRDRRELVERLSQPVFLRISMVWSEATGPRLFGFLHSWDKTAFEQIRKLDGIGPGAAMKVLDVLSGDEWGEAHAARDERPFKGIPGIGPKLRKVLAGVP